MIRLIALFVVAAFALTISGCNTVKGASQGAKKDWQDTCTGVKAADKWVNKNLW